MKKIYMTPSVRVHRLRVESQILAGTIENVNGAQNALKDTRVLNLNLTNQNYLFKPTNEEVSEENPFLEVE